MKPIELNTSNREQAQKMVCAVDGTATASLPISLFFEIDTAIRDKIYATVRPVYVMVRDQTAQI